ncbi:MAG: Rpn family recombination-promoting nuclease/putative transposase [Treponema sp.]|nr:Rpn family recombination-promoting nuclease/putative transposase [Treponema sp.]
MDKAIETAEARAAYVTSDKEARRGYESSAEVVEEIIQMDKAIAMAEARAANVMSDKEARRAYEMRQMALSDWTSGVNHARREGIKEGLAEGQKTIARNLKALGVSVGQIAQATGLSETEIAQL